MLPTRKIIPRQQVRPIFGNPVRTHWLDPREEARGNLLPLCGRGFDYMAADEQSEVDCHWCLNTYGFMSERGNHETLP